jgi:3D (Asp-Asp-Asp) domain-containing protein
MKQNIKRHRIGRERVAAFLTLLLASTLVTYAATGVSTAAEAVKVVKAAGVEGKVVGANLVKSGTTKTPVNGDVRAADEPPSRSAIGGGARVAGLKLSNEGELLRSAERTILMEVTAYCACKLCCGPKAQGITASGKRVSYNGGKFVAADTDVLPFGTKIVVPGYNRGRAVPVADRGGAIRGRKLDLYFPTHREAREWGRQWVEVKVIE